MRIRGKLGLVALVGLLALFPIFSYVGLGGVRLSHAVSCSPTAVGSYASAITLTASPSVAYTASAGDFIVVTGDTYGSNNAGGATLSDTAGTVLNETGDSTSPVFPGSSNYWAFMWYGVVSTGGSDTITYHSSATAYNAVSVQVFTCMSNYVIVAGGAYPYDLNGYLEAGTPIVSGYQNGLLVNHFLGRLTAHSLNPHFWDNSIKANYSSYVWAAAGAWFDVFRTGWNFSSLWTNPNSFMSGQVIGWNGYNNVQGYEGSGIWAVFVPGSVSHQGSSSIGGNQVVKGCVGGCGGVTGNVTQNDGTLGGYGSTLFYWSLVSAANSSYVTFTSVQVTTQNVTVTVGSIYLGFYTTNNPGYINANNPLQLKQIMQYGYSANQKSTTYSMNFSINVNVGYVVAWAVASTTGIHFMGATVNGVLQVAPNAIMPPIINGLQVASTPNIALSAFWHYVTVPPPGAGQSLPIAGCSFVTCLDNLFVDFGFNVIDGGLLFSFLGLFVIMAVMMKLTMGKIGMGGFMLVGFIWITFCTVETFFPILYYAPILIMISAMGAIKMAGKL